MLAVGMEQGSGGTLQESNVATQMLLDHRETESYESDKRNTQGQQLFTKFCGDILSISSAEMVVLMHT